MTAGTTPAGAADEREAAAWVRGMFGRIAPRYDLLNHLLSGNSDKRWRAHTVHRVREALNRPGARVLDLCCGTGDLTLALAKERRAPVLGSDFCHPMLVEARRKNPSPWFEADALTLPLRDGSLDLITVAFGFRNLANYERGLTESLRVLRPGGMLAILEFSTPPNQAFAAIYRFYSLHVLPRIGGLVSGAADAYSYLPESVRKFPKAAELAEAMRSAGFGSVEYELLTWGVVALHIAHAPSAPR